MKILEFHIGDLRNGNKREYCVVGALARSQKIRLFSGQGDQTRETIKKLSSILSIRTRDLFSLVSLNDSGRWTRLTKRLKQLELYHLVAPFALNNKVVKSTKLKQEVA